MEVGQAEGASQAQSDLGRIAGDMRRIEEDGFAEVPVAQLEGNSQSVEAAKS